MTNRDALIYKEYGGNDRSMEEMLDRESWSFSFELPFENLVTKDFMINRLDKNEHALLLQPKLAYWLNLEAYYINQPETFMTVDYTEEQVAELMRGAYHLYYPWRF